VYEYDVTDSTNVTDFAGLIKGFGPLARERLDLSEFPCPHCSYKNDCYGAESLVTSRLIPFSFYSFHLLVFEAMSLSAADFLALLGGSSFSALEDQLVKKHEIGGYVVWKLSSSMIPSSCRSFSKTMTSISWRCSTSNCRSWRRLPASFFRIRGIWSDTVGLLMDALWIRIHADGMRLPYAWNFGVDLIDTVRLPDEPADGRQICPYAIDTFLGWFGCTRCWSIPGKIFPTCISASAGS